MFKDLTIVKTQVTSNLRGETKLCGAEGRSVMIQPGDTEYVYYLTLETLETNGSGWKVPPGLMLRYDDMIYPTHTVEFNYFADDYTP